MDTVRQFEQLIARHGELIRRICVRYSDGDEQLCHDLIQEAVSGMWIRYPDFNDSLWSQWAWVYWQTRHFVSHALRANKLHIVSLTQCIMEELAQEDDNRKALIVELGADLESNERRMLDLMMQGYRYEEIAAMTGVSLAKVKRTKATMVEKMRTAARRMGMITTQKHDNDGNQEE